MYHENSTIIETMKGQVWTSLSFINLGKKDKNWQGKQQGIWLEIIVGLLFILHQSILHGMSQNNEMLCLLSEKKRPFKCRFCSPVDQILSLKVWPRILYSVIRCWSFERYGRALAGEKLVKIRGCFDFRIVRKRAKSTHRGRTARARRGCRA